MNEENKPGWTEALGEEATNPEAPRKSGDVIFALGQEWTVSSVENRIKAQFEQWVRKRARKSIQEAEIEDGPEEAIKLRSTYQSDYGAGHYNWDGRHVRSARGDWPGIQMMVYLVLRRCHPNINEQQVDAMLKENPRGCLEALGWALGNSPAALEGSGATNGTAMGAGGMEDGTGGRRVQATGVTSVTDTGRTRTNTPVTMDGP